MSQLPTPPPFLTPLSLVPVFPTVAQLLEYRKLSALAAPDVVALGTLNFGSLEDPDALIVVVAPSPEDKEEVRECEERKPGAGYK